MDVDAAFHAPIGDVARAIREANLSSVDLVGACLDRIAARDGTLQSFVHVAADALEQAKAAERGGA